MEKNLKIVNAHLCPAPVSLIAPSAHHYLILAAEVGRSLLPFYLRSSKKKKRLISQAKNWCRQLATRAGVVDAVVFKALVVPPGRGKLLRERRGQVRVARYDVVILIETETEGVLEQISSSEACVQLRAAIKNVAYQYYITKAINVKRIGPVDHQKPGVFLFNYFYADNLQQNIAVWAYTAGWFQKETGLDNSTVLLPQHGDKEYMLINHCRWDNLRDILPDLLFKRTFRNFVLENFYANQVAPMPVLYGLA